MSNKLTRDLFDDAGWAMVSFDAIQSHTAECVAEAVAEAVKNRYEIGENLKAVLLGNTVDAVVAVHCVQSGLTQWRADTQVRRPPTTRKMTDDELRMALGTDQPFSRPTLEAMAADLGIKTEIVE